MAILMSVLSKVVPVYRSGVDHNWIERFEIEESSHTMRTTVKRRLTEPGNSLNI